MSVFLVETYKSSTLRTRMRRTPCLDRPSLHTRCWCSKCPVKSRFDPVNNFNIVLQGDTSSQRLYFIDFDLGVLPCYLQGILIMPDIQLPKQNKADNRTNKSKSTKCSCSRRPDGSPCNGYSLISMNDQETTQ